MSISAQPGPTPRVAKSNLLGRHGPAAAGVRLLEACSSHARTPPFRLEQRGGHTASIQNTYVDAVQLLGTLKFTPDVIARTWSRRQALEHSYDAFARCCASRRERCCVAVLRESVASNSATGGGQKWHGEMDSVKALACSRMAVPGCIGCASVCPIRVFRAGRVSERNSERSRWTSSGKGRSACAHWPVPKQPVLPIPGNNCLRCVGS